MLEQSEVFQQEVMRPQDRAQGQTLVLPGLCTELCQMRQGRRVRRPFEAPVAVLQVPRLPPHALHANSHDKRAY